MLCNKQRRLLVAILLVVLMVFVGCARYQPADKTINLNLGTEPPTIDPALTTDDVSGQCVELLFLGLTDYDDETMEVIPELAIEWQVSADGLVWTFKLRKDVEWVRYDPLLKRVEKKGKVTAHDVVYGVRRTVDPATAAGYAHVNYVIKNAEAINMGASKDLESLGVRALDDWTVEFTLEQPAGYFPAIAGLWVNRPVPRAAIEAHGDAWTEPGNLWTNGPYMLETWEHEHRMVMVKNPHYYDAKNVAIETIHWAMITDPVTAFAMYERGELDVATPPLEDIERVKADPQLAQELHIAPYPGTYSIAFNTTKPPFDNVQVRQAFSAAIDRQKLIETVLKGGQRPAKSFACPGIFGSVAEDPNFEGARFDPERARQLLAGAGYPNGEGLPEIVYMFATHDLHRKIAEFLQQNWKEHLGVDVQLANQEWRVYLRTMEQDAPQVFFSAWMADYPDQNNWVLEVFHPTKGYNMGLWSGPAAEQFARLTEQAAVSANPEERKQLYFEAEKILVEDEAVIAPIYYYTRVVCTKPYVERTYAPLGGEHIDKWRIAAR